MLKLRKYRFTRKTRWLFLSIAFVYIQAHCFAQSENLRQIISVNYNQTSLSQVLNDISLKADIQFSYSPNEIPSDMLIQYSANRASVETILNDILQLAHVHMDFVGGYYILRAKTREEINAFETENQPKTYTISGYIVDSENQEAIIGAAVYEADSFTGTLTNNYGFFSLTLPEGEYTIAISYLGYNSVKKQIKLNADLPWNASVEPATTKLEEVVISSFNREEFMHTSLAGQTNIKLFDVEHQTAALGETDLLKSFGSLPGISFQSDGSSYFYVRGGNRDQNLILLDEAPIYNPSHMLGLFTPIIPEVIKTTKIYKADFPIQYGGRLSSVIDIRTRDGNMEKLGGSVNVGLISTRLSLEGPIRKSRSSFFLSTRRSHFERALKKAEPNIEKFNFTDFTAKLNIRLGDKDRLFLTLYNGNDAFITNNEDANISGLEWGNTTFTARWNHIFGNRLFMNTTLYSSKYDYFLHTDYSNNIFWNSHISSSHLKSEFSYYLNPLNEIKFGIKLGTYRFNPGNFNSEEIAATNTVSPVNSSEAIIYAGNEHKLSDKLLLNYGIRVVNWSNFGESFVVNYQNYQATGYTEYAEGEQFYENTSLEPRISLSYKTGRYSSVKASYNRSLQHIHLINNSISPFNTLEVWLPSGPNIRPQKADILSAGLVQGSSAGFELNIEVYYKKLYNQIQYAYHANTLLNAFIESELRQGDGRAYGFEIMLSKTLKKLHAQLSYAYTRSFLQIDGLNGNREFPARQDKPIDINLNLSYKAKPRWMLTANFAYASGMTTTTPTSFYYYRGAQVPVYTEQNNQRLPNYQRFDIGSDWKLNQSDGRFEHHLELSVFNFFNHVNAPFLYFTKTKNNDGKYVIPTDMLNPQTQVPTIRYTHSFVPSVRYYLRF